MDLQEFNSKVSGNYRTSQGGKGRLNGTFVNGVKCGGRGKEEQPEDAAGRRFPEVDLKHGDEISVGGTRIAVKVWPGATKLLYLTFRASLSTTMLLAKSSVARTSHAPACVIVTSQGDHSWPFSANQRSASSAAMQPVPAAVTACL